MTEYNQLRRQLLALADELSPAHDHVPLPRLTFGLRPGEQSEHWDGLSERVTRIVLQHNPGLTADYWDRLSPRRRVEWLRRAIAAMKRERTESTAARVRSAVRKVSAARAKQPPGGGHGTSSETAQPAPTPATPPAPFAVSFGEQASPLEPNRSTTTTPPNKLKEKPSPTDTELLTVWRREPDRYSVGEDKCIEVASRPAQDMLTAFLAVREERLGTGWLREKYGISNPSEIAKDVRRLFGHNAIQSLDRKKNAGCRMIVRPVAERQ